MESIKEHYIYNEAQKAFYVNAAYGWKKVDITQTMSMLSKETEIVALSIIMPESNLETHGAELF